MAAFADTTDHIDHFVSLSDTASEVISKKECTLYMSNICAFECL